MTPIVVAAGGVDPLGCTDWTEPGADVIDLDTPLTLRCGLTVPGRVAMAPLTNTQSHDDGTLSDAEHRWLARRAEGGFHWVSTCAAYVDPEGKAWPGQLGVAEEAHLPGLTRLATSLKAHGSRAVVQLHHGGTKAELAPGLKLSTVDGDGVRGATLDDLDRIVAVYAKAAALAERAGFDGVELHGANGYLFTQFLAPKDNPRTDAYGGSIENRARLLRRAAQAVRATVKPGFAVGVRLSPVDLWDRRGLVLDDSLQVAQWMAEDGLDFVHLSLRDASGPAPHEADRGPVVSAFRAALPPDVALIAVGGVWTRDDLQRALAAGADLVALGRGAIGNPDWPRQARAADFAPVRPPFTREHLAAAAVSERFVSYISPFPGMVVGGTPPR